MPEPLRFDEGSAGRPRNAPGAGRSRVIVKVRKPGYVPEGFALRTRVDDLMFTADAGEADLASAAADPDVESVEQGRPLHLS
ncbi:hypothetical protein [Geodermatophilus sp. URMC 64]